MTIQFDIELRFGMMHPKSTPATIILCILCKLIDKADEKAIPCMDCTNFFFSNIFLTYSNQTDEIRYFSTCITLFDGIISTIKWMCMHFKGVGRNYKLSCTYRNIKETPKKTEPHY